MDPTSASVSPTDAARAHATALAFLEAVRRGDEPAARALLLVKEGESVDFQTMHESTETFTLGPPTIEGVQVVVTATVTPRPGKDVPPALPIVLTRSGAGWKIDMGASMNRLLGVDVEALVRGMAEGLGAAMSAGLAAIGEGLSASSAPPDPGAAPEPPRPTGTSPRKRARRRRT